MRGQIFAASGNRYEPPRLVLFDGRCNRPAVGVLGNGTLLLPGLTGRSSWISLFFRAAAQQFGAPGDFAQAYVVAHEVGHHVQNLLGVSSKVTEAQRSASEGQANALSVRLELQADCLAGVWGNPPATPIMDQGDAEEGLRAASIGDDRLQRQSQGTVVPEKLHARVVRPARRVAAAGGSPRAGSRTATRSRSDSDARRAKN